MAEKNIYWHEGSVSISDREKLFGQKGVVLWFTGLSGSGKSTLARSLETNLFKQKRYVYVLDGDNIRHGLNKDLGFSPEHRKENIRRIAEVSSLFQDAGCIVMTAFISPYREDRDLARSLIPKDRFWEIYVSTSLKECERRDTKGLYKKARNNEIPNFTGISSPYEEPTKPELTIDTEELSIEDSSKLILKKLQEASFI